MKLKGWKRELFRESLRKVGYHYDNLKISERENNLFNIAHHWNAIEESLWTISHLQEEETHENA